LIQPDWAADSLTIEVRGISMKHYVGNARLRLWAENMERIEPEILDWIDSFEPHTVLYDLGASIGLFSIYAAMKAGAQVVSFETEAQNFAVMELNHYLNREHLPHPLIALNLALSNTTGMGKIYCRFYGAGEHVKILDHSETRDTKEGFEPAHIQSVMKQPLDRVVSDFGLPAPSHIKIDVDGSELEVLFGASQTLANRSVKSVFIELYEPDSKTAKEAKMLEGLSFQLVRKVPVVRLSGGVYPGLFNCIFKRD
jgi:FkbM family methyltransferase